MPLRYVVVQTVGAILGAIVAHGMFEHKVGGLSAPAAPAPTTHPARTHLSPLSPRSPLPSARQAFDFDGKDRDSGGEFFAEIVATVGLLITIFGSIGVGAQPTIPMAVGLYITAGYWFTSSTSFANPAVTIGRTFTGTFAGISLQSWPAYFGGQFLGLCIGLPFTEWMFLRKSPAQAVGVLVPGLAAAAAGGAQASE